MTGFDLEVIDRELRRRSFWQVRSPDSISGVWVLDCGRRPGIEIAFDGEDVRITCGRIEFTLAYDDVDPDETVIRAAEALATGGAQEVYGIDAAGEIGYLGFEVRFDGGAFGTVIGPRDRELFRIDL
jgi:hypothetical protein